MFSEESLTDIAKSSIYDKRARKYFIVDMTPNEFIIFLEKVIQLSYDPFVRLRIVYDAMKTQRKKIANNDYYRTAIIKFAMQNSLSPADFESIIENSLSGLSVEQIRFIILKNLTHEVLSNEMKIHFLERKYDIWFRGEKKKMKYFNSKQLIESAY